MQVQKIHTLTGHRDCVYTLQPGEQPYQFFSGAGDGMIGGMPIQPVATAPDNTATTTTSSGAATRIGWTDGRRAVACGGLRSGGIARIARLVRHGLSLTLDLLPTLSHDGEGAADHAPTAGPAKACPVS